MYCIQSAATISHQPSFASIGFSSRLSKDIGSLIKPDYKDFVPPALIRRMSEILRMSVACSNLVLKDAGIKQPDAIITGTGLGCLYDTEKFLNNAITIEGGLLPPTSFIQSTHNTIAGQISLVLGNHQYNMTHTQNSLSFEHALLDAMLMLDEDNGNILIGSADEVIDPLLPIAAYFKLNHFPLTSGTSFYIISKNKNEKTLAVIEACHTTAFYSSLENEIKDFLSKTGEQQIDFILNDGCNKDVSRLIEALLPGKCIINYSEICGLYATNSAFALHLATDIICNKTKQVYDRTINSHQRALIINSLLPERAGFIMIKSNEA